MNRQNSAQQHTLLYAGSRRHNILALILSLWTLTAHAGFFDDLQNTVKKEALNAAEDAINRKTRNVADRSLNQVDTSPPPSQSESQSSSKPLITTPSSEPDTIYFPTRFSPSAESAPVPNDSETSRQEAISRLRSTPQRTVCKDKSVYSRLYGTTCASREYSSPPLLETPKFQWMVNKGWWAVWSPFLIGDKMLTGSCNNEDNKGLSALDMRTGKTLWRIGNICEEGERGGTMGNVSFFELDPQTVLFLYEREDGAPADYYVVDVKAGKIMRTLKPVKRGGKQKTMQLDGVFMTYNTYDPNQHETTYLYGMSSNMEQLLWSHDGYRYSCDDLDQWCTDVFTPGAGADGIQYFSITDKDQPDPPARRLHAIDVHSGKLLWKHTSQPVTHQGRWGDGVAQFRSNDDRPMVADGKVIIQVAGLTGPNRIAGGDPNSYALRALDAKTGAILWTTDSIPTYFKQPWGDAACAQKNTYDKQRLGNRLIAGDTLVTEVIGYQCVKKELWGYRLSDGKLMWRRPLDTQTITLTASAGGVFYTAQQVRNGKDENLLLQGIDGLSGTLLWTAKLPGHNIPFLTEWDMQSAPSALLQGPSWRIGKDGAIYGVTLKGAYKLQ